MSGNFLLMKQKKIFSFGMCHRWGSDFIDKFIGNFRPYLAEKAKLGKFCCFSILSFTFPLFYWMFMFTAKNNIYLQWWWWWSEIDDSIYWFDRIGLEYMFVCVYDKLNEKTMMGTRETVRDAETEIRILSEHNRIWWTPIGD